VPPQLAHRCWLVAYFASWVLFLGGACGLAAVVAWSACGPRLVDDDAALLGFPLGAVLGVFAARATVRRRGVHRTLVVLGVVAAAAGTAGAMSQFAASTARHGEGPFSGLGEALVGMLLACVAALGVAACAAGAAGRLAARTEPGARVSARA
jgi:hypothetical protein